MIVTLKNGVSSKIDGYQKMCHTNKNVTTMGWFKGGLLYLYYCNGKMLGDSQ